MKGESKRLEKIYTDFDPIVFGITFWQTLVTNWWYNIVRDLVKEYVRMSQNWHDTVFMSGLLRQ